MTGDMGEIFNAMRDERKALRGTYGVACPRCAVARPKAYPSILLPQQRCKVDGYRDPRPRLTDEQRASAQEEGNEHRQTQRHAAPDRSQRAANAPVEPAVPLHSVRHRHSRVQLQTCLGRDRSGRRTAPRDGQKMRVLTFIADFFYYRGRGYTLRRAWRAARDTLHPY